MAENYCAGTTPFQLNVNLNLELENGKPNKVSSLIST